MMPFKVEDFVAATFTPMTEAGEVNVKAIDHYQQFLLDQGVTHVYVNGSTGEGPCLTTQERKDIVEEWIRLSRLPNRSMKVMVQVGGTTVNDSIEMDEAMKM